MNDYVIFSIIGDVSLVIDILTNTNIALYQAHITDEKLMKKFDRVWYSAIDMDSRIPHPFAYFFVSKIDYPLLKSAAGDEIEFFKEFSYALS